MFKKIEIWVLYLTLVVVFISYIIFGWLIIREHEKGDYIPVISSFSKASYFLATIPRNIKMMIINSNPLKVREDDFIRFQARGDRFKGISGFSGETNEEEIYYLLSRYNGDIKQSITELIDLRTFKVLHTWNPDINTIFQKIVIEKDGLWSSLMKDRNDFRFRLTHPIFEEDGSLIFHHSSPLIKIDKNSNLEWMRSDVQYHHSNERDKDGNYWHCVRYFPFEVDSRYVGEDFNKYMDHGIRKLSSSGEILFDKSISNIFLENDLGHLLFSVGDKGFNKDPIHLNDIQPVEKDTKYWKKGDVFLSLRHQSMILLYRPKTNKIIWKTDKKLFHQHDVDIINDNKISIFNNNSKDFINGDRVDGNNQVVIYDFKTKEYSYYLNESLKKKDVRTITHGRSQILPNGDLIVEESNYGRTLYFNYDGSQKWEHINRASDGNVYKVSWSRVLYKEEDIKKVHMFLKKE
ncbi:arylsulfotransferase family protein [Candidatus Marinimicrobia bacterium]|nr:arylsulfotransferase family protein [Candidatus Neomarinimicrobiota bacterium]